MSEKSPPSPEDIQKEFEEFIRDKFGGQVQVVSHVPHTQWQDDGDEPTETAKERDSFDAKEFSLLPQEVKQHLDQFVIKQDEAKKALSIAVCDHYNHVKACLEQSDADSSEYSKQNVLILGPTGVGKTYLVKQIAKLIGVPFVKADATRFSETGYVGANVEDLIKDLVTQAGGDIERAQYGIVYLDEADKLGGSGANLGRDVTGRGVQFGLLKLMEETEIDLRSGNDPSSQLQAIMEFQQKGKVEKKVINTRHILFIVSGAFSNLEAKIKERHASGQIGFHASAEAKQEQNNYLQFAETSDFVDFGFEPEFIGRLPVRVTCEHLSADDLFHILRDSKGSIIRQYEEAFRAYGIEVEFTPEALRRIAEKSASERTGARALMTICERTFRDYKFTLPSVDIEKFTVTAAVIDQPAAELKSILAQIEDALSEELLAAVKDFESKFEATHGMVIRFKIDAIKTMRNMGASAKDIPTFLESRLTSYEHGLKLIRQNTGQNLFELSPEVIKNPKGVLEEWIKESYRSSDI